MSISSTEGVTSPFAAFGSCAAATSGMSGTSDGTTATGSTDDKQMFLELMVTQLRYQDPLNPTDSSEFLAQSAQFTALEKMQDVADQTALLASSQLAFGAISLPPTLIVALYSQRWLVLALTRWLRRHGPREDKGRAPTSARADDPDRLAPGHREAGAPR